MYKGHGYITDITTTKNIERTSHAQKMESIGRLTAGLAHDFNNLLMAISGYNELNKFSLEEVICENCDAEDIKAEITSNSAQINRACSKAADLIQKMMLYCRRDNDGNIHNPVLNLNEKIQENLSMIRGMMPSTVIFETHLVKQTLALPELDETNFNQILINLYVNARDAMNEKGKITLSTEIVNIESHCFCCKADLKGSYIEVNVADTGAGMNSSIASRIFEPFYTTKEVGEGTGLGLSAVVGIVHNAGGHVLLESEVDVGTTFRLLFPNELQ
jgi:signal transduction histidine kinase